MKTVTKDDVRSIIRSVSIASGAISFVCAPVPGSDTPFLTALTLGMVTGIAGKFDYVNPIAGIFEAKRVIASGAFVGTGALKIATSFVSWILGVPTAGAALALMCGANALTAFGTQEYIGWQSYKRFKNNKVTIGNSITGAVAIDVIGPAVNELAQDIFDTSVTAVGEMASDESKLKAIKKAISAITPEFKNVLNSVQEIVQSDLVQDKSKVVFGRIASNMAQAVTTGKKVDLDGIVIGAIGNEVVSNYFAETPSVSSEYENTYLKTKLLELKQEMLKDRAIQRLVEELRTKAGKEGKQLIARKCDDLIKKYYEKLKEKSPSISEPTWSAEENYHKWIKSVYEKHLQDIKANELKQIWRKCGKVYEEIYQKNISLGYWRSDREYDHSLVWYMAEWLHSNPQNNEQLGNLTVRQIAECITDNNLQWIKNCV